MLEGVKDNLVVCNHGLLLSVHYDSTKKETAPARGYTLRPLGPCLDRVTDTGIQYNALPLAPKTPIRVSNPIGPVCPR